MHDWWEIKYFHPFALLFVGTFLFSNRSRQWDHALENATSKTNARFVGIDFPASLF